jgi:hypothetical protein
MGIGTVFSTVSLRNRPGEESMKGDLSGSRVGLLAPGIHRRSHALARNDRDANQGRVAEK